MYFEKEEIMADIILSGSNDFSEQMKDLKSITAFLGEVNEAWKNERLKNSNTIDKILGLLEKIIPGIRKTLTKLDRRDPINIVSDIMEIILPKMNTIEANVIRAFQGEKAKRNEIVDFLSKTPYDYEEVERYVQSLGTKKAIGTNNFVLNEQTKNRYLNDYIIMLTELAKSKEAILEYYEATLCIVIETSKNVRMQLASNRQVAAPLIAIKDAVSGLAKANTAYFEAKPLILENIEVLNKSFHVILAGLECYKKALISGDGEVSQQLKDHAAELKAIISRFNEDEELQNYLPEGDVQKALA